VSAVEKLVAANTPGDLAAVLDEVAVRLRRYVVMTEAQVCAVALWVVHTHTFSAAEATPYLNVKSAEKESGKTRLLEVLDLLVARPWFTARTSVAALVRKLADDPPATLLLDESDTTFKNDPQYVAGLMGILNAGYRKGGRATLCVGQGLKIEAHDFPVFAPKALAGIGKLPDTVASRSIRIELKRRAPGEEVARFRRREAEVDVAQVREKVEAWTAAHVRDLATARPDLPDELSDRAQDVWEPLLAIADMAGEAWAAKARAAAVELSARGVDDEDASAGVQLLAHIRDVFDGDRMTSKALCDALNADDEMPYGGWNEGKGISTRELGRKLVPYRIRARKVRIGDNANQNGYLRAHFGDAWTRYVPPVEAQKPAQGAQPASLSEKQAVLEPAQGVLVPVSESGANPHGYANVPVVPVSEGGMGARGRVPAAFEDGGSTLQEDDPPDVNASIPGFGVKLDDDDDGIGFEPEPDEQPAPDPPGVWEPFPICSITGCGKWAVSRDVLYCSLHAPEEGEPF
jgi:hypothetical protein